MSDSRQTVDRVLEATADLRTLRDRLAELDAERAAIQQKIQQRLSEIGLASGAPPDEPVTTSERILDVMRREPNTVFTAMEFAMRWRVTNRDMINTFRSALWRLNDRGKIERVSFGRYRMRSATR